MFNSEPQVVTGTKMQTSNKLKRKEKITRTKQKTCFFVSEAVGHFTAFNLIIGVLFWGYQREKSTESRHCVYWLCLKGAVESLAAGE